MDKVKAVANFLVMVEVWWFFLDEVQIISKSRREDLFVADFFRIIWVKADMERVNTEMMMQTVVPFFC
jgi:hypothetical protein